MIIIALKVGELFATLNLDTSGFSSSLIGATNLASSEGKAISAIFAGLKLGKELTESAITFESAFAEVKKTVDETAFTSYEDIEQGLRNMAKEIPATLEDLTLLAGVSGQLGISADNLLDFTRVMADLGETTNFAAGDAATTLARFTAIMGTSSSEYSNLGSTIVALGNNFATTESEIAAMAMRIAGAGSQVGLTESEVLGFAAAFSSVGIEADAGGSAFSTFISNLSLAVAKGGASLDAFAGVVGMSGAEFSEAFGKDAASTVLSFVNSLGQSENAIKVLSDLGITEIRQRDALLRAAEASEMFASAVELSNGAYAENTALAEEAQKRYDTTASKLDMLKNKTADFGLGFGKIGKEVVDAGLDVALNAMDKLAETTISVEDAFAADAASEALRYMSFIEKDINALDMVIPMMFTPKMSEETSLVLKQLLIESGYINEAGEVVEVPIIAEPVPVSSGAPDKNAVADIVQQTQESANTKLSGAGAEGGRLYSSSLSAAVTGPAGVSAVFAQIPGIIKGQVSGLPSDGAASGKMFSSGIASGILSGKSSITAAARSVARAAAAAVDSELQIHSPSRVTTKSGGFFSKGMAKGILKDIPTVTRAASEMASMAAGAVSIRNPAGVYSPVQGQTRQASAAAHTAQQPIQLNTYLNGRKVSEAMSDDTAYTQNGRSGRIAMRYGTKL